MRYISDHLQAAPSSIDPFPQIKKAIDADPSIKLIFLCSPGNPTGTLISLASLRAILDYEPFKGIVVVDEAYIDFSEPGSSAVTFIAEYANICVMQTLSKSFGLAGIRCILFFPSHSLHAFLIGPTQTRHSSRTTATYPGPHKYEGSIQHLLARGSSRPARSFSRISQHYARKY
jgi:Aminotransferase class I and II